MAVLHLEMNNIMKLPQDNRYEVINWMATNMFNGNANQTAKFIGCSYNTVINAMRWCKAPSEIVKPGPESILKPHHDIFIISQTHLNHYLTNQELSVMLKQYFPDIPHLSESTVDKRRKQLGLIYTPPISTVMMTNSSRTKRINWCLKI